jgi:hypothetical protein
MSSRFIGFVSSQYCLEWKSIISLLITLHNLKTRIQTHLNSIHPLKIIVSLWGRCSYHCCQNNIFQLQTISCRYNLFDGENGSQLDLGEIKKAETEWSPLFGRPQGDSNPCYRNENPESWASRRWGL